MPGSTLRGTWSKAPMTSTVWLDASMRLEILLTRALYVWPVSSIASLKRTPGLSQRTQDEDKNFVYLQRQVAADTARSIQQLKVPGVQQLAETRRFYPEGEVMAHIVGFTNIEDRGIEGIELAFNDLFARPPKPMVANDVTDSRIKETLRRSRALQSEVAAAVLAVRETVTHTRLLLRSGR